MNKPASRAPVEYVVLEKSLIGNEIFEAGATVKYDGLPAENLQPTCEEGERRADEYRESNRKRQAAQREEFGEQAKSAFGDPEKFTKMFAAELAKATAEAQAKQAEVMSALQSALAQRDEQIAALAAGQDAVLKAVQSMAAPAAPAKAGGKADKVKAEPAADLA